jgi:hypothetical protein
MTSVVYKKFVAKALTENKEQNLEILKEFYQKDWGGKRNTDNDKLLYEVFKNKDINERCIELNAKYSTRIGVKNGNIKKIAEIISTETDINPDQLLKKLKEEKLPNYKSFISKYCHWYYEVYQNEKHYPIFDTYVRYGLIYYGIVYHYIDDFSPLHNSIDHFISTYLPNKGSDRVELKTSLHHKISVYRLVDKFLWLQYKQSINNAALVGIKLNLS